MKCKNEYCETELQEWPDYEDHKDDFDEDYGNVVSVWEVRKCGECGFVNYHHVGDRPR